MSKLTRIPLPSGTYQLPEASASDTQLVNMMAQIPTQESGQKFILVPTPGLVLQTSGGTGPVRAMVALRNTAIVYESNGSIFSSAGGGAIGSGVVTGTSLTMATDGINVLTCTNGRLWATTGSSTTEITSSLPFPAGAVCFLNGYFVVSAFQSNVFFISGLNALTWDPLDFATCEGGSSSIYGCLSIHLDVWFFCHDTIEVWYLSGAADFPFQRQQGGFLEVGVQSPLSHVKCDNSVYWVGNDRKVYMADGYAPRKVSDAGLDRWMFDRNIGDALGISLTLNGQNCYAVTFISENTTWVFSTLTQQWFNLASGGGISGRWRIQSSLISLGLLFLGDSLTGTVASSDPATLTELGGPVARAIQFQNLYGGTKRAFMGRFMIDCYANNDNDTMLVQWSNQSGVFNTGRTVKMTAAQNVRLYLTRLGSFRRRLFLLTMTPVGNVTIIDAWAEITPSSEAGGADDGG